MRRSEESLLGKLTEGCIQMKTSLATTRRAASVFSPIISSRSKSGKPRKKAQVSHEIARDTKHSDRKANSPCVVEGRRRWASAGCQPDSRQEGEEK
jgi:hypothetical protein